MRSNDPTALKGIVTGGLQGIGRAIVDQLVACGHQVAVFDIHDASDARVKDLAQAVRYCQVDVSSVSSIKKGFSYTDQCFDRLDFLVNNAGITDDALAIRLKEEQWDRVLDVNLKGSFFCSQQALIRMVKQNRGYIIMMSSVVAHTGNVGQSHYAASKAGLIALTKSLAQEYGRRNILVNAIAPGLIQTSMTDTLSDEVKDSIKDRIPQKRFGSDKEVAFLVQFLLSGEANYITGQVININGGMI